MSLQYEYGKDRVIALLGNHEEFVLNGYSSLNELNPIEPFEVEDRYIKWLESLPRYYQESFTIFVHAGIDEDLGESWEYTDDYTFTNKYPTDTGKIEGLDLKIVAGHIHTSEISGDDSFSGIYYDGLNHYYLDGDVLNNRKLNVLLVETGDFEDKYFTVTEEYKYIISKYF